MSAPARRRPQFHPLTVAKVEQLTDDAVAVTFDIPDELAEDYRFKPGQALTLRYRLVNMGPAGETKGAGALVYFVPVEGN